MTSPTVRGTLLQGDRPGILRYVSEDGKVSTVQVETDPEGRLLTTVTPADGQVYMVSICNYGTAMPGVMHIGPGGGGQADGKVATRGAGGSGSGGYTGWTMGTAGGTT